MNDSLKRVLILGSGRVSYPMIHYYLDQPDLFVEVAGLEAEKYHDLFADSSRGRALHLNIEDNEKVIPLMKQADLVVSLLPYAYHPFVAERCIEFGKPLITTSYVSDAMRSLDEKARTAGVLLLNEMGVDPGIDHMSAMRLIHRLQDEARITGMVSYCGGLPAPEFNTNPMGYKFSWSPRGVALAGRNPAQYLRDGKTVLVEGKDLFAHHWDLSILPVGKLQAYPNRDSIPYLDLYGLNEASTLIRGTLRYPGWCETWQKIADLGLLNIEERNDLNTLTYRKLMKNFIGKTTDSDVKAELSAFLGLSAGSEIISRFEWLGFFTDETLPETCSSLLDVLSMRLLERMPYEQGEQDMIVLHHVFQIEQKHNGRKENVSSTLIEYGVPDSDSAMSRAVSLPAAIAGLCILKGQVPIKGVQIPVRPEIYDPVLDELEFNGMTFEEKRNVQESSLENLPL